MGYTNECEFFYDKNHKTVVLRYSYDRTASISYNKIINGMADFGMSHHIKTIFKCNEMVCMVIDCMTDDDFIADVNRIKYIINK